MSILVGLLGLLSLSVLSIYHGSKFSLQAQQGNDSNNETLSLTSGQAMIMPLTSSAMLLLLFFFFNYVQMVLVFLLIFLFSASLYTNSERILGQISCLSGTTRLKYFLSFLITAVALIEWLRTGNFIAHDLLGCSTCITLIATLQFPSLKVAFICLTGLLLYDIFWVFISESIFKKNVMVEVATRDSFNPVRAAGELLNIPILELFQTTLNLPLKLIFPVSITEHARNFVMLGLGDIALPGMLIAYALRCDDIISSQNTRELVTDVESNTLNSPLLPKLKIQKLHLFGYCLCSYSIALLMAFYVSFAWGHAQPALIYLVPAVIIPMIVRASQFGVLSEIWHGMKPRSNE